MSTLIQVRNVPADAHEKLKARAAAAGKSLNSYMLELIEYEVERPTKAEVLDRIRALGPSLAPGHRSSAELIREAREERDRQLMEATSRSR